MFSHDKYQTLSVLLLITTCLFHLAPTRAEITGDKELLTLLAKGFSENWDAVHTWQGEATIEQSGDFDGKDKFNHAHKANVKFVFDKQSGSLRWELEYTNIMYKDGDMPVYRTRGMLKDGLLYDAKSTEGLPPPGPGSLHIRNKNDWNPRIEERDRFHPMTCVKQFQGDTASALASYHDDAKNKTRAPTLITREGSLVTVSIGADTSVLNHYVFDTSKGCNIVIYNAKDAIVEVTVKFDYAKAGERYAPSKVEYAYESIHPTHSSRNRTTISFIRNVLNEDLAADEFTLEKMGMLPGDTIFNHITGLHDKVKKPNRRAARSNSDN